MQGLPSIKNSPTDPHAIKGLQIKQTLLIREFLGSKIVKESVGKVEL